ncbi:MAG: adenylosuccinate lyase [Candidatus Bathyarchaeota archaeon]|nr:adenylosuccinate lyase [Candidatus Bathyarchaeota archaeon]
MPISPIDSGRYGSHEMRKIFDEEFRLQVVLDVEAAVAYAHSRVGNMSKIAADEISKKANTKYVKIQRCEEIEKSIGHDLMARVIALTEVCEKEGKRWVHFGLTSADVEDTATALQFKKALEIIEHDLVDLNKILLGLIKKYRHLVMVGRTHGQHMGVTTLGFKFAVWSREIARHLKRLSEIEERVLVGKIMGAIGTGAGLGEKAIEIQKIALEKLDLKPADMVTQVIQRDIHAELISFLTLVACSLDKIALEVRNLQRTEIMELMEPFEVKKQVGSSAMPAKRNPVKSERICSLAKLMRSLVIPAYENIPLWHERDLTNSANERFLFSNGFIILDEMLKKTKEVLKGIVVNNENMKKNLKLTGGLILSERVVNKLVEKGMNRQEAHELVRKCSMQALSQNSAFKDALKDNRTVSSIITDEEIDDCLDYTKYLGVTQELIDNTISITEKEIKKYKK